MTKQQDTSIGAKCQVECVERAANRGARSVRGLRDEDYEDAVGHAFEACVTHSPRNLEAYARTAARNYALKVRKEQSQNAPLGETGAEYEAAERSALSSGRRHRPRSKLTQAERTRLSRFYEGQSSASQLGYLIAAKSPALARPDESRWYKRLARRIESDFGREAPENFVEEMSAFRARLLAALGMGERLPGRRGAHRLCDNELTPSVAERRKRKEAARALVARALQLCGFLPEDYRAEEEKRHGEESRFLRRWIRKVEDAEAAEKAGAAARSPAFRRRGPTTK